MGVTYDAGALVAADRGERRTWARHRALLQLRQVPTVPAPVVAQAWRGGSRPARLSRFLVGCTVERLDDSQARRVGELLARAALSDIVDGTVVEGALRLNDLVISSDPGDLGSLSAALHRHLEVDRPSPASTSESSSGERHLPRDACI
ncbi:MAG: twitching motility protein PilT [Acidimicrobiales bacterium]